MTIIQAYKKENTWFIFRETGVEVEVVVKNNMLRPSHQMKPIEVEYFRNNVLQVGEKIINASK